MGVREHAGDEHEVMYRTESPYCPPETNITLFINYVAMIKQATESCSGDSNGQVEVLQDDLSLTAQKQWAVSTV